VPPERQHYLGVPDGEALYYLDELTNAYTGLILAHNVRRLITLGERGWDEHPDHRATHVAAERAKKRVEQMAWPVGLRALNAAQAGPLVVHGNPQAKYAGMQHHHSQHHMHQTPGGPQPNPVFWQTFAPYHPLLHHETYDIL